MSVSGYPIQNHSHKLKMWIEGFESMHKSSSASRRRGSIYHQQNRQTKEFCYFSAAALFAVAANPIKKPHHSFDHGEIGVAARGGEDLLVRFHRQHPGIQIVRRALANQTMMAGIDKIRSTFKRLHSQAAFLKRR